MRVSSKRAQTIPITVDFTGGLNLSRHPSLIADNECARLFNFTFEPGASLKISTRKCLACMTETPLTDPITVMIPFIYGATPTEVLIGVAGNQLYQWTGSGEWTAISGATTTLDRPALCQFGDKLYVADGSNGLFTWDGTTYTQVVITGVPAPDALIEIGGRLVANHVAEPDSVYFSAPYNADATGAWDYNDEAIGIKAGFGDQARVVGFAKTLGQLIVSKTYGSEKQMYVVDTTWTPSEWKCEALSFQNASQDAFSMTAVGQHVYFLDTDGFQRFAPTQEFGDLSFDPTVGNKINNYFSQFDFGVQRQITFLPSEGILAILPDTQQNLVPSNELFVYSPVYNTFAIWQFPVQIYHACEWAGDVYLAGPEYLYKMADDDADEYEPGVTEQVYSVARSKLFKFQTGGAIIHKVEAVLDFLQAGFIECSIYKDSVTEKVIVTPAGGWEVFAKSSQVELYDALGDLDSADLDLGATITNTYRTKCRFRSQGASLQLRTLSGRITLGTVTALATPVMR